MSDISGPTSSLPGSIHKPSNNATCDTHPTRLATQRVQGETDSFGAEYIDMCSECFDAYLVTLPKVNLKMCDWCHTTAMCRPHRDLDEGSYGRVYDVCTPCIQNENAAAQEELDGREELFSRETLVTLKTILSRMNLG